MRTVCVPEEAAPPSDDPSPEGGGGVTASGVTVSVAFATLVESSKLAAVTVTDVATVTCGAANNPATITPLLADQVTAELAAPATLAVKPICSPKARVPWGRDGN